MPAALSDFASKTELMRSLGRLVRGLSALFWGLPLALVVFGLLWIQTVAGRVRANYLTEWIESLSVLPPLAATGFLFYALRQLGYFQPQERQWQRAVEKNKMVAVILLGLSPFMHWWNQLPNEPFYRICVALFMLFSLLFLAYLNQTLNRLAAMLPDETLRVETRFFTSINFYLLTLIVVILCLYYTLSQIPEPSGPLIQALQILQLIRQWLLLFLILLPLAMTMTLIWKIKETILESVFSSH